MSEERVRNLKELRNLALTEHDHRAEEIDRWSQEHGGAHHRVNRYISRVTQETVDKLIQCIQKELEAVLNPDAVPLLAVFSYLQSYDFTNTDEAGRDALGFSLAVSELDVALHHLDKNSKDALRYLAYRYKTKMYPKEFTIKDFPMVLYVESALACNLMCIMCYQSDPTLQKYIKGSEHRLMDWDLFTKVIDEAARYDLCAVVFAGRGEPTLNKRFSDMLRYCRNKGILDIKFNTNATKITETMVRDWLSIGAPLTVVFSVDAADKKGFEEIRIGANFDEVIFNINMFNRIRMKEFPDSPVRTRISMTLFKDDQDPEAARKLWAPLVDEFTAKNARSEQSGSIYLLKDGNVKDVHPEAKCKVLFDRLYVWCDGTVNPCEDDYMSSLRIGNAYQESLHDLWRGPKMMKLRVAHISGKKNTCYPCNGCSGY